MIDFTNGVQTVNFPDAFQWKNNESMPNITAQNLYIFKCLYLYTDPIAYTGEFITSVINDDYDSGIICTNDPNNVFYGQIYMNEATITDNQELTIGKNAQINTLNAVNNTESADHLMLTTINVYGSIGEIKISNTLDDPDGTPEYEDLFHINVDGGTISKITGIHNPSQDWTISEYDIGTITISDGYVKSNTNGCSFNLNMTGGYFTGSVYSFNISGGTCGVLEHNYDAMGSADGYIFDGVVINSISYNSGTLTINGGTIHNLYAGYMSGQNYVINGGLIENFDLEDESEYPSCGIESLIINGGTVKITARLKNYMDNNNITPSISENATVIYLDE